VGHKERMNKTAVVTGAGSGVGRAVALALSQDNWRVALLGRREETLRETVKLAGQAGQHCSIFALDVGDATAVETAGRQILKQSGSVEVLVNAVGTNMPARALAVLSLSDYHALINTNLNGAYYCVQAFLPSMRRQKAGTIVNIVSEAGKQANPKAGPAYV